MKIAQKMIEEIIAVSGALHISGDMGFQYKCKTEDAKDSISKELATELSIRIAAQIIPGLEEKMKEQLLISEEIQKCSIPLNFYMLMEEQLTKLLLHVFNLGMRCLERIPVDNTVKH